MAKFFEKKFLEQLINEFKQENFNIKMACLDLIYECTKHFAVVEYGNIKNAASGYLTIYKEINKLDFDVMMYKKSVGKINDDYVEFYHDNGNILRAVIYNKNRLNTICKGTFLDGLPYGICFSKTRETGLGSLYYIISYGNYINNRKDGIMIEKSVINNRFFTVNNYLDDEIICPTTHIYFDGSFDVDQKFTNSNITFFKNSRMLMISYNCPDLQIYIEFKYVDFKISIDTCMVKNLSSDDDFIKKKYRFDNNILTDSRIETEEKIYWCPKMSLKNIYEDVHFKFRY